WRSGYATVCKTVYPGSIPGVASKTLILCGLLVGIERYHGATLGQLPTLAFEFFDSLQLIENVQVVVALRGLVRPMSQHLLAKFHIYARLPQARIACVSQGVQNE